MATAAIARMSYADYLVFEEASDIRHELIRGEVFALPDSTIEHSGLAVTIGATLSHELRPRGFYVLMVSARVRVEASQFTGYPDVYVVSHKIETDHDDPNAVLNPTIIVEVFSEASEAYDRGEKFAHYRGITSLREYVLVSQRAPLIEVHRRNERGNWELFVVARAGQKAELVSCGAPILLDVDEIYRDPLTT